MRSYSALRVLDQIPVPPDTVGTLIGASAGGVVSFDWPTGVQLANFASNVNIFVNFFGVSTGLPTTNSSGSTGTTSVNILNPGVRQISTAWSTGYSVTFITTGFATAEFWKK